MIVLIHRASLVMVLNPLVKFIDPAFIDRGSRLSALPVFLKFAAEDAPDLGVVIFEFSARVLQLAVDLLDVSSANGVSQLLKCLALGCQGTKESFSLVLIPVYPAIKPSTVLVIDQLGLI